MPLSSAVGSGYAFLWIRIGGPRICEFDRIRITVTKVLSLTNCHVERRLTLPPRLLHPLCPWSSCWPSQNYQVRNYSNLNYIFLRTALYLRKYLCYSLASYLEIQHIQSYANKTFYCTPFTFTSMSSLIDSKFMQKCFYCLP